MAAVITQPPVIFETAGVPARAGFTYPAFGPYEYTAPARLYQVLIDQVTSALAVYKSIDGGATWTAQDAANGPILNGGGTVSLNYAVTQRGNILSIIYPPLVYTGQRIVTFDVSTDTFGAPSAAGPTAQLRIAYLLQLPSSGDLYAIYEKPATSPQSIFYAVFSGGIWATPVQITAETLNSSLLVVLLDPDERIHVYYDIPGSELKEVTVLAGVVAAATTVRTGGGNDDFNEMGQPTIWGTKIVLPYIFEVGGIPLAAVLVGDTFAGPTTWDAPHVIDTVPTVTIAGEDLYVFALVSLDGLTAYVFWIALDYGNPSAVIDQMWYASNSGSGWSAPILYYDAVANPQQEDPSVLPINQDLHTISVAALSNGTFGVATAMEENSFCAGYFLLEGAGACDITITVTPHGSGPVTVPNDGSVFALPPAYGLTPYTFSGPLTTPNAPALMKAVEGGGPPQNFEYSIPTGNLPAGMSLGGSITGSASAPVQSSTGLSFQGTPTENPSGPVTVIWTGKVKLVA